MPADPFLPGAAPAPNPARAVGTDPDWLGRLLTAGSTRLPPLTAGACNGLSVPVCCPSCPASVPPGQSCELLELFAAGSICGTDAPHQGRERSIVGRCRQVDRPSLDIRDSSGGG